VGSLLSRVVSAAIALLVLAADWYWGGQDGVVAFSGLVLLGGCFEYCRMVCLPRWSAVEKYFLYLSVLTSLPVFYFAYRSTVEIIGVYASLVFTAAMWFMRSQEDNSHRREVIQACVLGILYCGALGASALAVAAGQKGMEYLALLLAIVFLGDILAYFGGKTFGKNKLMPKVSPNKTWEGSFSGAVGSCLGAVIVGHYFFPDIAVEKMILLGAICAPLAQTGDLFESLLKRIAGVKDSGRIMPGHGGVLDRLDGVYFAAPAVLLAKRLLE
jgi:phosphatidate cytidylyltransferase